MIYHSCQMDSSAKQLLLTNIIEYAKLFQTKRNRKRMTANDVHDAIHALGYRPLFSGLGINGDEIIQLPLEESWTDRPKKVAPIQVHVHVRDSSEWIPSMMSTDNFRPRKVAVQTEARSMRLSPQTKQYVRRVIDSVNRGESATEFARNQSDALVGSWFLGLHFSDTVSNKRNEGVNWLFVRQCLWFLDNAMETYKSMRGAEYRVIGSDRDSIQFPEYLFATWMIGLDSISQGVAPLANCECQSQARLVQKICDRYIQKFIKQ